MVRVAGLQHAIADGDATPDLAGLTPAQQLTAVAARAHAMVDALYRLTIDELLPALAAPGIQHRRVDGSRAARARSRWRRSSASEVLPVLTPLAIDVSRPFPLLSSLSLNLALLLDAGAGRDRAAPGDRAGAAGPRPAGAARRAPGRHASCCSRRSSRRTCAAVPRPADPGVGGHPAGARRGAGARRRGRPHAARAGRARAAAPAAQRRRPARGRGRRVATSSSRCCASSSTSAPTTSTWFPGRSICASLMGLIDLPGLRGPARSAAAAGRRARAMRTHDRPVLGAGRARRAAAPSLRRLRPGGRAAWRRPPTIPTCWPSSRRSIARASDRRSSRACSAPPSSNKQVTVLVELTARFDEERNIRWARALEEAGAHVIYGVRGYKTHAKICLIVRRTPPWPAALRAPRHRQLQRADGAHLHRLRPDDDVARRSPRTRPPFFNALTGYSDPPRLKKLVMAPTGLRRRFLKLIDRERRRAEAGQPAEIVAKMNSLDRRGDHRRALRGVAGRREDPAQRARHLRAAAGRAGRSARTSRWCRSSTASSSTRASTTSSTAATRRSTWRAPTG